MEELQPIRQDERKLIFDNDNIASLIEQLKDGRLTELPNVEELEKQYYVENHDVFDKAKRKDKPKKKKTKRTVKKTQPDPNGGPDIEVDVEEEIVIDDGVTPVNRIGLSQQKKIVNQAVAFTAGNPVQLTSNPKGEKETLVYDYVLDIFEDNKIDSFNRKLCRSIFAFKEAAECWYHIKGSDGNWKLRVMLFAPQLGDTLYPYFDDFNDMVAFSREYKVTRNNELGKSETIQYFTTYTSDMIYYFQEDGGSYKLIGTDTVAVGKIQIIYGWQELAEYEDVNPLIARREKLRSNFGDTNDYHASPKTVAEGKVLNFTEKEEAGGIIQLENGAKVSLLTWDQAPEAIKLEDELLNNDIHALTDTADLSFNNLKSLGGISGETLRRLLTAPILKVYEKKEYLDEYMQRRVNLVKAYVGVIYPELKEAAKTLRIKAEIVPLQLEDYDEEIDRLKKENGGKALISQIESVRQYMTKKGGNNEDADRIYEEIKDESASGFIEDTYQV